MVRLKKTKQSNHANNRCMASHHLGRVCLAFALVCSVSFTLFTQKSGTLAFSLLLLEAQKELDSTQPTTTTTHNGLQKEEWPAYQKYPWQGVPKEEVGHALVKKGKVDFVESVGDWMSDPDKLEEFLKVYENRPDKVNLCGMRINHSLYLYATIKYLQPTTIIESGVNAGHSTYLMRAAAPNAKIYAIDPLDIPICEQKERWIDPSAGKTEYYTGTAKFQDFNQVDWAAKIAGGEINPDQTLVLLDDHLDPSTRYPTLLKHGFRHLLLEDNYKRKKGATEGDRKGFLPKQLFHGTDQNAQFFFQITKRYAEFPPLVSPLLAKEYQDRPKLAGGFLHVWDDLRTIVAPLLRPDLSEKDRELYEQICQRLNIDPRLRDLDSYMQVMNYNQFAYMEMMPMAPRLLELLIQPSQN
ncbi:expressed unknown protein [Seminavis robusta]|uniref:Uncharacterized protein n=1 Tax=Seminavis robusta TaxID=568900 RepID=A0A9N8DVE0_9STRA|nr:expressed unknown protein [Seminavis robusta]|eukprot:Sro322_g116920.1 n/a (411) ;mRNA; f:7435-8667